jgi:sterol desaturase/sphingolipid hydroxylase (fatty acid hydroxylase superfamily)
MRMSKWSYHADFIVYPVLIVAIGARSLWQTNSAAEAVWLLAAAAGWLAWSALEYIIHRWVLHRTPPFRGLHAQHHLHPSALIGTPTWLSATLFAGLWVAVAHTASGTAAGGLTTGLMSGYLVYTLIHDAVHHRAARPGSWLYRAKIRHALHHRLGADCNFGVSSGVWDTVLGTSVSACVTRHAANARAPR